MKYKNVVFKVGTSTLTHKTGRLNLKCMDELVTVLSDLMNAGVQVTLVTSGAIGVGVGKLRLSERPSDTAGKQAAATVGQCELMFMYDKLFSQYGHKVGQLLITKEDVEDSVRRTNLINTFDKLFHYGAIPIVNENDSVAVEEIVYGDNDSLSAVVSVLIKADALIMLTETDGLYNVNPQTDSTAKLIKEVEIIDDVVRAYAGDSANKFGTGGMITKVHAADIATSEGIDTFVISGANPRIIYDIFNGISVGTHFKAVKK